MWLSYTALLLHGLGLPTEHFSPTFAVGRVAGWIGHAWEQLAMGRLIRPASEYAGAHRAWFVSRPPRPAARQACLHPGAILRR